VCISGNFLWLFFATLPFAIILVVVYLYQSYTLMIKKMHADGGPKWQNTCLICLGFRFLLQLLTVDR
jgi:hypothetical protein